VAETSKDESQNAVPPTPKQGEPNSIGNVAQQATTRPAQGRLEFAAVSIRPPEPGGSGGGGFACRGVDGIRRANAGEQGNPDFAAPQGRCVGYGISLGRLVEFAYNMPHRM